LFGKKGKREEGKPTSKKIIQPKRDAVSDTVPMCYLMDNAAVIVVSPDFLSEEYSSLGIAKSDSLPVFVIEPEMGMLMVEAGVIDVTTYRNFKGFFLFFF
jgi:uncharacterized membrane protein